METKTVFMLPDFRKGNPYQELLKKNLKKENINVIFPDIDNIRFSAFFRFLRLFKNSETRIMHFHFIDGYTGINIKNFLLSNFAYFFFIFDMLLTKYLLGTEIIWTAHNLESHEKNLFNFEKKKRKIFLKLVDKIIAHCNLSKEEIKKSLEIEPSKIEVIHHGNYIGSYQNSISRSDSRRHLKIDSNKIVFLFFGQIRPYKGLTELIENFKSINDENLNLIIAGKPLNDTIKNEVIDNCRDDKRIITNISFVKDEEIQYYMNASDVVVFPYRNIFTSGGIHLAMSFGKAIIAPRIGCIGETLDKKGSIIYDSCDEKGLGESLKKSVKFNKKLKEMGEHNYKLAEDFSWDKIAKKTKQLYLDVSKK